MDVDQYPLLTSNPEKAYRLYRSAGPVPCSTRGKRAIVVGAISSDGVIIESFEFLIGLVNIKKKVKCPYVSN